MKNFSLQLSLLLLTMVFFLSSCEVIGDIFKAGMGVGIFIVVAIVGIILFFVFRGKKS